MDHSQKQVSKQVQKQQQKLSHRQIQALKFLEMGSRDLCEEVYKLVSENPAIEIVKENYSFKENEFKITKKTTDYSNKLQSTLESQADRGETLQSHLMHQLNTMQLIPDEFSLSEKLIYNLDKNGLYGSSLSPESLLDWRRPLQTKEMLVKCIERIQKMDPVGTCCRTPEESLFVQAKFSEEKNPLALFILDGHLELLNPPESAKILKKLLEYKENWHKKAFAPEIVLDKIKLNEEVVSESLKFILSLNPRPAQGYTRDTSAEYEKPDVILTVERCKGVIPINDYSKGLITGDENCHFQIKYASGILPELRISKEFEMDKENVIKAQELIANLEFRESSIVLQGCAIVNAQREFFLHGPEYLSVLTRRQVAKELGIHESTVSRMAARNCSKYIQTEWGLFPASYFFSSGIEADGGEKISAETIKIRMQKIIKEQSENISDLKLTELLNEQGIKIARRTVTKYRLQLGIRNSYDRF